MDDKIFRKHIEDLGVSEKSEGGRKVYPALEAMRVLETTENITRLLCRELGTNDQPDIRMRIVMILARKKDPDSIPALKRAFRYTHASVAEHALWAMAGIVDDRVVPILVKELKRDDYRMGGQPKLALENLFKETPELVVNALMEAYNSKKWVVRAAVINILGSEKIIKALPLIVKALADKQSDVCSEAIKSLVKLIKGCNDTASLDKIKVEIEKLDTTKNTEVEKRKADILDFIRVMKNQLSKTDAHLATSFRSRRKESRMPVAKHRKLLC